MESQQKMRVLGLLAVNHVILGLLAVKYAIYRGWHHVYTGFDEEI